LVVEDDPGVREGIGMILDDHYDVLFAEDGPPALQLVRTRHIDVVLLDLGLPSMNGFDVLAGIKEALPRLPVIVVTITATTDAVVRAMKLGAFDYITKPFRDDDVLGKVSHALRGESSGLTRVTTVTQGDRHLDRTAVRANSESPLRARCLLLIGHVGTAGTLRLLLGRSVSTDVARDGIRAVRSLGAAVPDCVVCDDEAWMADGSALIRVLRMQSPQTRVVMMTSRREPVRNVDPSLVDAFASHEAGVGDVVRRVLAFCAVQAGTRFPQHDLGSYVLAAMDYLRFNFAQPVSAQTVADVAGVSRGHLTERFRAELGLTLAQYLMSLRVEVAKVLLGERAKLEQVATLAGFSDPSHLSRVFRATTGQRPGAFRRQTIDSVAGRERAVTVS
jgi:DNA-binding response OmpR family regulator/AraC-like DNA-binding protein